MMEIHYENIKSCMGYGRDSIQNIVFVCLFGLLIGFVLVFFFSLSHTPFRTPKLSVMTNFDRGYY